jgi:outer membrane protein OmpA-like peptidoglycan-associated protein
MKWIVLTLFFPIHLLAGEYDLGGQFGMGLGGGFYKAQNSDIYVEQADEDFVAGLWFRYHLSSSWALELSYDHLQDKSSRPKHGALDFSLALRMWSDKRFRLLAQIGAGMMQVQDYPGFTKATYQAFAAKSRLGFEYMLSQSWALGLHADYHYADVKKQSVSELHIFAPMIGITYYFNETKDPSREDSDGDGVTDERDKCPHTMAGFAIDDDGCPLKKEKAIVDSDYDGVPDSEDHCPQTQMGKKVNATGCSIKEKLEFSLQVTFASGRSEVGDEFADAMQEFADFMHKHPNTKAEIAGHTDNSGSAKLNYALSQKRAEAVRNFLVSFFKISPDRLTAKGYGPSQPIADNGSVEGRQKNRRVVATVQTEVD